MPTLIITAPNKDYNGKTFGVKFEEGRAVLNEHSNPNRYGYSLADLAQKFRVDLPGYEVEFITDKEEQAAQDKYMADSGFPKDFTPEAMPTPAKPKKKPAKKATRKAPAEVAA